MNANEHNQLVSPNLMPTTPCICLWVYTRLAMGACTQAYLALTRPLSASRPPFGTPTDRSLCHTFVALSDRWISTSSLGLFMNANEHDQLTSPNLMLTI